MTERWQLLVIVTKNRQKTTSPNKRAAASLKSKADALSG